MRGAQRKSQIFKSLLQRCDGEQALAARPGLRVFADSAQPDRSAGRSRFLTQGDFSKVAAGSGREVFFAIGLGVDETRAAGGYRLVVEIRQFETRLGAVAQGAAGRPP